MVIYYYDATALGSNYTVNDQDFHWVVVHVFERHGWQVIDVYLGNPMRHDDTSAARSSLNMIYIQFAWVGWDNTIKRRNCRSYNMKENSSQIQYYGKWVPENEK